MTAYRAIDLIMTVTPQSVMDQRAFAGRAALQNSWDHACSAEQLISSMDRAGIAQGLLAARAFGCWNMPYEAINDFVMYDSARLFALAGIDPTNIRLGLDRLETAIKDMHYVGAHSYPHWFGMSPDDRKYYPFYAKCVELGVPIQIQVGRALQPHLESVGRPDAIDRIAVDFPELKVVAIHTGFPWEREMVAVVEKHPNVYLGADTRHPQLWATEIVDYIRNSVADRVMFGTDYPSGAADFAGFLDAIDKLGFDGDTLHRLLITNVRDLYKLPVVSSPS